MNLSDPHEEHSARPIPALGVFQAEAEITIDGVNDIVFIARALADGSSEVSVASFPAPPASADTSGLAGTVVLTDTGYSAEVFVPWAALQVEPMSDWAMGFAMIVNDDDGNDLRVHSRRR